jgi:ankyrin repeat protein
VTQAPQHRPTEDAPGVVRGALLAGVTAGCTARDDCRRRTNAGLFAAGWNEDVKLLALLITLGAPVDERAEDETAFLHCWKNGRFGAARFLVRKGADVNFQDSAGRTALHYGVRKEFEPKVLRALVRVGASADVEHRDGISPRRLATRKRDKRFLEAIT